MLLSQNNFTSLDLRRGCSFCEEIRYIWPDYRFRGVNLEKCQCCGVIHDHREAEAARTGGVMGKLVTRTVAAHDLSGANPAQSESILVAH